MMHTSTEYKVGKLIYDDGELRNCPANKAQIGYWATVKHFNGYRVALNSHKRYVLEAGKALIEGLIHLPFVMLFTLLLPVLPLITGYRDWAKSKREVAKEKERNAA